MTYDIYLRRSCWVQGPDENEGSEIVCVSQWCCCTDAAVVGAVEASYPGLHPSVLPRLVVTR